MVDHKSGVFMASRPMTVDARSSLKSYMAAFSALKALAHRNNETVIELMIPDNKGILHDISTWCETTGNELISSEAGDEGEMRCLIQKGEQKRSEKKMVVVVSTAGLESVCYAFDKAIAGAVLGMDVSVCFEGAGVRLLKKGYKCQLSGFWGRLFTGKVEKVMEDEIGWPLPGEAIQILEELGASFYACGPSMIGYEIREEELAVKNIIVAATITWVDLLSKSDVQVFTKAIFEKP